MTGIKPSYIIFTITISIMRKQIAAANWKMNLTKNEAQELMQALVTAVKEATVIVAVPFPYLTIALEASVQSSNISIAAQNCHHKESGAYTGEVSAPMLQSLGVQYCLVGHSERREYFAEHHQMLAHKVDVCLANNITPIFCCGEPLSVREAAAQNHHVEQQLRESLFHLSGDQVVKIILAYEPVWAIGTGKTATEVEAQDMHRHIRSLIAHQYNAAVADAVSILYGGSVKAANAGVLFSQPDVDGGLVGGASLVASEFISIAQALKK